jgi:DNA polymerase-3 subunit alpha
VQELVDEVAEDGGGALAVTDHAICAAHPELQKLALAAGIKPVFGIEANFTTDRLLRGDPQYKDEPEHLLNSRRLLNDYNHLILWAETNEGLRNLWAMSTIANLDGKYGRPRMDWDVLERHHEGVMASTACLRGLLAEPIRAGDEEKTRLNLARLLNIFGDGLLIEIHTNQLEEQKQVNIELVRLAQEFGIPMIAAVDSHYPCADYQDVHQLWIAVQTNKELVADDADLFDGGQEYHLKLRSEVFENLATYLPREVVEECISNTTVVANRCHAEVKGATRAPVFSKEGGAQRDVERLTDLCLGEWEKKVVGKAHPQSEYMERFEREMSLLVSKEFCGYFMIVAEYCRAAKANGKLVGPGRGSGGGSLVAYLSGITDLDPVDADLMFERFLTEGRTELPDFDIDFPASAREWIEGWVADRWGHESVIRVGTHIRLKNKGVFKSVARALKG